MRYSKVFYGSPPGIPARVVAVCRDVHAEYEEKTGGDKAGCPVDVLELSQGRFRIGTKDRSLAEFSVYFELQGGRSVGGGCLLLTNGNPSQGLEYRINGKQVVQEWAQIR